MTYKEIADEALLMLDALAYDCCLTKEEEAMLDKLIFEFNVLQLKGE